MGEKLMEYYSLVEEQEGLTGKMELAERTQLPGTKASTAPDSEENIERFREVSADILDEDPPLL
jgi:hypothetical protein